jgi:hypothetical protein
MTRTWLSTEQTLPIHVYIIIQIYQSCNSFQIFNLTLPIYLLTASPWLLQPPHNGSCHSQPCHDKIRHELTYSCQLVCNEILEHQSQIGSLVARWKRHIRIKIFWQTGIHFKQCITETGRFLWKFFTFICYIFLVHYIPSVTSILLHIQVHDIQELHFVYNFTLRLIRNFTFWVHVLVVSSRAGGIILGQGKEGMKWHAVS